MINYDDVYKIGRIGKPHGVKGEVAFRFTDDVFDTACADCLFLGIDGILVPFFIDEYRFHGAETALVKFFDVDTREQADAIVGCDVYIPRSLAADGDGQLSLQALAGYTIIDAATGAAVGRVSSIDDSTANVLFVTDDGIMVPASDDLIDRIDTGARTITARLPEGLLDI